MLLSERSMNLMNGELVKKRCDLHPWPPPHQPMHRKGHVTRLFSVAAFWKLLNKIKTKQIYIDTHRYIHIYMVLLLSYFIPPGPPRNPLKSTGDGLNLRPRTPKDQHKGRSANQKHKIPSKSPPRFVQEPRQIQSQNMQAF